MLERMSWNFSFPNERTRFGCAFYFYILFWPESPLGSGAIKKGCLFIK